ncbi:type IA DNA topoisomerase [Acanthopleuribacter pedis]|uniref:DNA topoisomerase n=1 Tax=Acanthopleuribacter pedis TaxID=442870 RepID=A0A8J7QD25_9BACT|nr:type IA DNA topoisomerase [Acanthopleuribacter pedis]MBO1321195.1 DNA topoisomerase 3 [Acanthopleuribacter pedis]
MKVVLAEKPSVARDIARNLGAGRRGDGYLSGNGWVVTWALGHLVQFSEPNDYHQRWAGRWSFDQLPMVPEKWVLKDQERTKKQLAVVQKLFNDAATEEIICATDAGREGENIFRLIYEYTGCTKPFRRLWISSLTDEAIREGFEKLQPGADFDDLAHAALARTKADWLVGMNMTRAYTVHNGMLCTIGRVQTPTLAMIVRRDWEIENFEKAFYYELVADMQPGFKAKFWHPEDKYRIDTKVRAERLLQQLKPHDTATVTKFEKKKKRKRPPQLYDLITLQKEANKRFGFTAKQVLTYAQELYEKFKLITYPRTESRHISEDMAPMLPRILKALEHPHASAALARLQGGFKLSKHYMDKTKLTDHHGILPTDRRPPNGLSGPLALIYNLVATRFVAIFLPDQVLEETTVTLDIGGETFLARGTIELEQGWRVVEPPRKSKSDEAKDKDKSKDDDDGKQAIPTFKKGDTVGVAGLAVQEKETSPPKPFNDATLLNAMKYAGRDIDDDALAEAMKDSGLGTPATRAEMIEKLIRSKFVERKKKNIHALPKGKALIGMVLDPLRSPELTGEWERRLKEIENGRLDHRAYMTSIENFIREMIPAVRQTRALRARDFGEDRRTRQNQHAKPVQQASGAGPAAGPRDEPPKGMANFGSCPRCRRGWIVEGNKAFGCTRYRGGCRLLIPKEIAGKTLTKKQITTLVEKGQSNLIKGFKDNEGKTLNGRLTLDPQNGIQLIPAEPSKSKKVTEEDIVALTCPKCSQGTLMAGKRGFGCSRFREGCRFVVWYETAGKKLTPAQVKKLVEKKKTTLIKGFKNNNGDSFDGYLVIDDHGQVQIEAKT